MHTLVAWQESIDPAGAFANLTGIADQSARVSGDYIYVGPLRYLMGAYACVDNTAAQAARIGSPSLRRVCNMDILPLTDGTLPVVEGVPPFALNNPIELAENEGMEALVLSNPASAVVQSIVALLSDGPVTPVNGEIHHVRVTASITETVGQWTNGPLTFAQTLPVGRYAVVGGYMSGTSGVAWRLVPVGGAHRPGSMCSGANDLRGPSEARNGKMGVWCEFDTSTPPTLDWLAAVTTGTSQEGILDLVRLG